MTIPRHKHSKRSGNALIGEIPVHWKVARIKNVLASLGSGGTPDTDDPAFWTGDEGIPWVAIGDMSDRDHIGSTAKRLTAAGVSSKTLTVWPAGTLLLSMYASLGHTAELRVAAATNQAILALVPKGETVQGFLKRWFEHLRPSLVQYASSNTQDNLNAEKVKNLPVAVPPRTEQVAIAAFLDQETAKIDALVEEQKRLIELLNEKRHAVISQAVTRGLDPTVPMKDSGVEWLGQVPAHWGVGSLTRVAERVVVGIAEAATHAYADAGTPILRSTNIRAGQIIGDILLVSDDFSSDRKSKLIKAGDLVTVRTGNAGVTAVVPERLDGCQCFTMLITSLMDKCLPEFYCYLLNSVSSQRYFSLEGWGTAQVNISVPILKALPVTIPSLPEQRLIVERLDAATAKLDALVDESSGAMTLLRERRSALISAAVTGKIDVRGFRKAEPVAA